jgi:hypothetical protein
MRTLAVVTLALVLAAPARADPSKLAVFDFEMIDTSLQGEVDGPRSDEHARLLQIGDQLRRELAESGKFQLLDIAPVNAAAHSRNLQACGGCDVQYAQQLGADLSITGLVQKISNLILNINIYVHNAHTGRLIASMNVDLRGNTDESWSRGVKFLVQNRLLAPNYGVPQPQ